MVKVLRTFVGIALLIALASSNPAHDVESDVRTRDSRTLGGGKGRLPAPRPENPRNETHDETRPRGNETRPPHVTHTHEPEPTRPPHVDGARPEKPKPQPGTKPGTLPPPKPQPQTKPLPRPSQPALKPQVLPKPAVKPRERAASRLQEDVAMDAQEPHDAAGAAGAGPHHDAAMPRPRPRPHRPHARPDGRTDSRDDVTSSGMGGAAFHGMLGEAAERPPRGPPPAVLVAVAAVGALVAVLVVGVVGYLRGWVRIGRPAVVDPVAPKTIPEAF